MACSVIKGNDKAHAKTTNWKLGQTSGPSHWPVTRLYPARPGAALPISLIRWPVARRFHMRSVVVFCGTVMRWCVKADGQTHG